MKWELIATYEPAKGAFDPPWVRALDGFGDFTILQLVAEGEWTPLAGMQSCGPNGLVGANWPDDKLLLTDCPVGALIGRIGGSSASLKSSGLTAGGDAKSPNAPAGETKPFPVGTFAVVRLPDKAIGPLFLGLNILLRPVQVKALKVVISGIVSAS